MARRLTIVEIVSKASLEIGIAQNPITRVIGSPDQDVVQMGALIEAVADELLLDMPYKTILGSDAWIEDASGAPRDRISADTDIVCFDGRLAISGVKWRFLKAKGLEFGEEMRDFTSRLNKIANRLNGEVLDLYEDEGRVI